MILDRLGDAAERVGYWTGASLVKANKYIMKAYDQLSIYELAAFGAAMDCFATFCVCTRRHESMTAEFSCRMSESPFIMPIFYCSIVARAGSLMLQQVLRRF